MGLYLIADGALQPLLHYAWLIFKVGFGLTMVIFVHELGHFLVAKACGVKCEKFYIGFDAFEIPLGPFRIPAALWKKTIGETEYGIGILPLGGYVKMLGQDDNPQNMQAENERIRVRDETAETKEAPTAEQDADLRGDEQEPFELDPRSYPARPVYQRMAIISAGVIMNLIFAVIFAAFAFQIGVSFVPCMVGNVTPGDPAWRVGLQPGDQIVQVGEGDEPRDNLRFGADLSVQVVLNGADRELPLQVRRPDGSTEWIRVTPTDRLKKYGQRAALGIHPAETNKLGPPQPFLSHLPAGQASPALAEDDVIVAVNGKSIQDGFALQAFLAQNPSIPLTLEVLRAKPSPLESGGAVEVALAPNRLKVLGLTLKMGPIVAVRKGSPAAAAELEPGDVILEINNQPIGDPVTLPQRTLRWAGQEIKLVIERDGTAIPKTITPVPPVIYHSFYGPDSPMGDEALGIAYSVSSTVASVAADSPAATAGIKAGDELTDAEFVFKTDEEREKQPPFLQRSLSRVIELDGGASGWPELNCTLQWLLPGAQVKLWYQRGGEAMLPVVLDSIESDQWCWEERGLMLLAETRPQKAKSWTDAVALGYRETKERFVEVLRVLGQLVTLRMSFTGLTGPLGVVNISVKVAEAGLVELLLFLTFISVNLSILNFLPIPALDGGHMVFLAAEAIRGKPVDEALQIRLTLLGIGFLLTLMLFVTVLDINRLLF